MYSNKRIFSKNDYNINYNDYNKLKMGVETLKTIKQQDNTAVLNRFNNYRQWYTLTSAYYPYVDNNNFQTGFVKNLYNSNKSFINKCLEDSIIYDLKCNKMNNTLYPYGNIIERKPPNVQFPANINLYKWCNGKNTEIIKEECEIKTQDCCFCRTGCRKNKNCKLCKNATALFI
jgi:hypothetical protein